MPRKLKQTYPELVKKSQDIFWFNGYRGVTAEDLANHLDVSVSTIYNKYTKEMLFMDSLEDYVENLTDPVLTQLRQATKGIESLKEFYFMLIDGLLDKTFPRSCFMVNTILEMKDEKQDITEIYARYFDKIRASYRTVLKRAVEFNEIKHPERLEAYNEFLVGVIFAITILYKIKPKEDLQAYVINQLSLLE